jgi:putative hemolysin
MRNHDSKRWTLGVLTAVALAACAAPVTVQPGEQTKTAIPPATSAVLPNPASVYCEQQGYRVEIRTAADGSQSGACIFPDGSECDEWAFYRGECGPSGGTSASAPTEDPASGAPPVATALPTLEGGYAGWQTYEQADYGFAFSYPPEWVVAPDDNPASTLYGHALFVQPADPADKLHLRIVFRQAGEDVLLWPTGAGEGEFVERDTVPFLAGQVQRVALVCQGHDMAVWYRGLDGAAAQGPNLEISFILAYLGSCADGTGLLADQQVMADMIVASFEAAPGGAAY